MNVLRETQAEATPRLRMIAGILVSAAYIETMHRERDALLSLARTQRRLSWGYRRIGLDDEATRLWADAKAHLRSARARNF